MKRTLSGLRYALVGYLILAPLGFFLIATFSSNSHDRGVEAAMTAIFVFGPLGAVIGFVVGFMRTRHE